MKFINLTIFLTVFLYSSLQASEILGSFTEKFIRDHSNSEQLDYAGWAEGCEHINISTTEVNKSLEKILILRRLKPASFVLRSNKTSDLRGVYIEGYIRCLGNKKISSAIIVVQLLSKVGPLWADSYRIGFPAEVLAINKEKEEILQVLERYAEEIIAAFIRAHMDIK